MKIKVAWTIVAFALIVSVGFYKLQCETHVQPLVPPLSVQDESVDHPSGKKFVLDVYQWHDARNQPRRIRLVRNDQPDPTENYGGYARSYEYTADEQLRVCTGSSDDNPGWGFLVNHYNDAEGNNHWITSLNVAGEHKRVFVGAHHAIHSYHWPLSIDGEPIEATVHWLFADGLDHPLIAITYDLTKAKPDALNADTRSPYGDIGWDGDRNTAVSGVTWGDRYKFVSQGDALSLKSGWSYTEKNSIPFVAMWSKAADAEMGIVQTQSWQEHDAGGYWFYSSWGKASTGPMPENWNWTYQLNQYQLESDPTSKRLAWGTNYGAVGQERYKAYGDDKELSGYPYQSYSVFMVLGTHSGATVGTAVEEMVSAQTVKLVGHGVDIVAEGPAGIERSDQAAYQPKGWNHVYGVWELNPGTASSFAFDFTVGQGTVSHPIFRWSSLHNPDAMSLELDGRSLAKDRDYLLSFDAEKHLYWLTILRKFRGSTRLAVKYGSL